MATVKALLAATKAERSKRGKYFKYSPELKEEIAAFAMVKCFNDSSIFDSYELYFLVVVPEQAQKGCRQTIGSAAPKE